MANQKWNQRTSNHSWTKPVRFINGPSLLHNYFMLQTHKFSFHPTDNRLDKHFHHARPTALPTLRVLFIGWGLATHHNNATYRSLLWLSPVYIIPFPSLSWDC